jgi:hypothetical protein
MGFFCQNFGRIFLIDGLISRLYLVLEMEKRIIEQGSWYDQNELA